MAVFEPEFMPGTGLMRDQSAGIQRMMHLIQRVPGVSSPTRSGRTLASIVLGDRWAHLRDGAFVVKDKQRDVKPFANDPDREATLWNVTAELLNRTG